MPQIVTGDIKKSIEIITVASKSFTTASFLFPAGKNIICTNSYYQMFVVGGGTTETGD